MIPKVGLLYVHIYTRMYQEMGTREVVTCQDAKLFLRNWRIPKVIRPLFLRELEHAGFLKVDGSRGKIHFLKDMRSEINYYDYYESLSLKN